MNDQDPFRFDDAAYVLGSLGPMEHAAFEAHLRTCDACATRVAEIDDVPDLLTGISLDDVIAPDERPPDTLLPGLLRRAEGRRRRQRWVTTGLATVAAACLIALVAVLVVGRSGSSPAQPEAAGRPFVAVVPNPVRATASLQGRPWGTEIDLHCHYVSSVGTGYAYRLVAYGRDGSRQTLGSWTLPPRKDINFAAGTSLTPSQLRKLEITLPDGTPLLRLRT